MPRSKQISVRLSSPVYEQLEQRAHRIAESRNSLIERYVAEGLQQDRHPFITYRDGVLGRRAKLTGTRLDVWKVIQTLRLNDNSVAETAWYLDLPELMITAAIEYYAENTAEVDDITTREEAASDEAEAAWRAAQAMGR